MRGVPIGSCPALPILADWRLLFVWLLRAFLLLPSISFVPLSFLSAMFPLHAVVPPVASWQPPVESITASCVWQCVQLF